MEEQTVTVEGRVSAVIFTSDTTGYSVLRLLVNNETQITLVGCIPSPARGEELSASGRWTTHPSHGVQFAAESVTRGLPGSKAALMDYLASGIVSGIGRATAKAIVTRFGERSLEVLENEPESLATVKGITITRARGMCDAYRKQTDLRKLIEFLSSRGIQPRIAMMAGKRYGAAAALTLVKENPYVLSNSGFGIEFGIVDELALNMGMEQDALPRLKAAVLYELEFNSAQGHTYLPERQLIAATSALLEQPEDAVATALDALEEEGSLVREGDRGSVRCYTEQLYAAECAVAFRLRYLASLENPCPRAGDLIDLLERDMALSFAPAQRDAIELASRSHLMLLTGGPGTGKTTTVRGMIGLFEALGKKTALAAPTGRAAKRMNELSGREAHTLHRLLEAGYDPESGAFSFARNEDEPLEAEVVIVDELSMVDIQLMDALTAAISPDAQLILVGDPDQLPAVGPGNVLWDIISSDIAPCVCLTEIFRQARESRIITGAHAVNRGELPSGANESDYFFIERREEKKAVDLICYLCAEKLKSSLGCTEIQVITPTRRGALGTASLNHVLQKVLNPPSPEKRQKAVFDTVYRLGDRVMQIKNNYQLVWRQDGEATGTGVFNGDMGRICDIDLRAETLSVDFDGRIVDYPFDTLNELEHSYAITVHKAQGSEYETVLFAAMPAPAPLMNRRVLYTAMTRARSWLVVVGQEAVMNAMVMNDKRYKRYSALSGRLSGVYDA